MKWVGFWILAVCGTATAVPPYPNTTWLSDSVPVEQAWYQQCLAVQALEPPLADKPPAPLMGSLKSCDAHNLYNSLTDQAAVQDGLTWTSVRHCAFATQNDPVLMMIYANGLGVPRNKLLSIQYACRVGGALAEISGRIDHLNQLKAGDPLFHLCDDITSGFMGGVCAALHEQQRVKARVRALDRLAKEFSPAQATEFKRLKAAVEAFATHRAQKETDMSGTARAAFATEAAAAEWEYFVQDLERFEAAGGDEATEEEFAAKDKELNRVYRQVMDAPIDQAVLASTLITQAGIRATQRAWLRYCTAWEAFGRVRYGTLKPWGFKMRLTQRRIEQLGELVLLSR